MPARSILPAHTLARLFVPDHKWAILEKLTDDGGSTSERVKYDTCSTLPSSSFSTRNCSTVSESRRSSLPYSAIIIPEMLNPVQKKHAPSMTERSSRPDSYIESDQPVDNCAPLWEYNFNLDKLRAQYDIKEVLLQNVANFLERENIHPEDVLSTSTTITPGRLTPPWSNQCSPVSSSARLNGGTMGASSWTSLYLTAFQSKLATNSESQTVDSLTEEDIQNCSHLSSGRMERLASKLALVNPLHLVIRDDSLHAQRPVQFIFWFISLLRPNLRRITFDGLQSNDRIRVDGVLPLHNIEQLTIRQGKTNPALIANEDILLSWLRLPSAQRPKIRILFKNCRRISPKGILRFIREWQRYPEVALFEAIIIDEDSMHPWDFLEEAEKEIMHYEKEEYLRPLQGINIENRSDEQAESLKKQLEFPHCKGRRAIKYYYEDSLLIFTCCGTSSIRNPPSRSCSAHASIGFPSRRSLKTRRLRSSHPVVYHAYKDLSPNCFYSPVLWRRMLKILSIHL